MVTIAGKADPTLVKMATAAEMADKPVSMQTEFKGITDTYTTYMTGIATLYAQEKAKIQEKIKPFEDVFKQVEKQYTDGTYTNEEIDSYSDQLNYYRGLLKKSKNEKERNKIMGQVNKFYNSVSAGNGENLKFVKFINAGEYDGNSMGQSYTTSDGKYTLGAGQVLDLFTKLGEKNYKLSWENDEKNYTVTIDGKDVTVPHSELGKMFKSKQAGAIEAFDTIVASQEAFAKTADGKWDKNAVANQIVQNVFANDEFFEYSVNNVMGKNSMSYRDGINSPGQLSAEMWASLNEIVPQALKDLYAGEDKVFDVGDFTGNDNWSALTDALTKPGSKNFDRNVARRVAASWFADQIESDYNVAAQDAPGEWSNQKFINQGITNLLDGFVKGDIEKMNQLGKRGIRFEEDNGAVKVFIDDEEYTLNTEHVGSLNPTNNDEVSLYDIVSRLGYSNDPVFQDKFMNTEWDTYEWGGDPMSKPGPGTPPPGGNQFAFNNTSPQHNIYLAMGFIPTTVTAGENVTLSTTPTVSAQRAVVDIKQFIKDNSNLDDIIDVTASTKDTIVLKAKDLDGNFITGKEFKADLNKSSVKVAEDLYKFLQDHYNTVKQAQVTEKIQAPTDFGIKWGPNEDKDNKAYKEKLQLKKYKGLVDENNKDAMQKFVDNLIIDFDFTLNKGIEFKVVENENNKAKFRIQIVKNGKVVHDQLMPITSPNNLASWRNFLKKAGASVK